MNLLVLVLVLVLVEAIDEQLLMKKVMDHVKYQYPSSKKEERKGK
jgi:hypothetical protein